MDFDFALILVCIVAFCGMLWLLDIFLLKPQRTQQAESLIQQREAKKGSNKKHSAAAEADEEFQQQLAEIQQEPLVIEYAKSFFPVLFLVLCLRSFLVEPFQIPTGSMIRTLGIGDFVLVNKYAYGVRLPVIGTKILDVGEPKRGEIMVFIPPHEDKYYIKRVVGLAGDTIRFEDNLLYVNGELIEQEYVQDITIDTSLGELPGKLYWEELGGFRHYTQIIDARLRQRDRNTWIVPNGHYFMMGDNRNNSEDSRVWGTVSEDKIVGKAIAVWMHKDPGWNLPTFSRNRWLNQ